MTNGPTYLDIDEAAAHIRQPVTALRAAVRPGGQLRHIRRGPGGKLWFRPEWLHAWMDSLEHTSEAAS